MPAALVARIAAEVPQVVAVKECSGDARRIAEILQLAGDRLEVLVGGDDWVLEGYAAGATGWVSGVAVCAPAVCVAIYDAVAAADLPTARETYARLAPLARLDMTFKLVQYFKAAQDRLGFAGGPVRPPRQPLTDAELAVVDAAVAQLQSAPVPA
jgi:4-hydroxy-tetrahydrodipicolinate synthase